MLNIKNVRKIDDHKYGDFEGDRKYGVIINDDETSYRVGEFDENLLPHHLNVEYQTSGRITLAKYHFGEALFPIVEVLSDGRLVIIFKDDEESKNALYLRGKSSSFVYKIDESDKSFGYRYEGLEGVISFVTFLKEDTAEERRLPQRFILDRPLIFDRHMGIVPVERLHSFETYEDEDHSCALMENSQKDVNGVGMIYWDDDTACVGGWNNDVRYGWQIYQFKDYYEVYYGEGSDYNGLRIVIDDQYVEIYTDGPNNEFDDSAHIRFNRKTCDLELIDCGSLLKEGDPICRLGANNQISYAKYNKDNIEYSNFINGDTYEAPDNIDDDEDDYLVAKKKDTKEKEKVEEKNPFDPEQKMLSLIGQDDAKKEFVRIKAYLQKNKGQDIYKNIFFYGDTGVGKTTVAKLLSDIFYKYGAIPMKKFTEISAKELFSTYSGDLRGRLDDLYEKGQGGVILINDIGVLDRITNNNIKEGIIFLSNIIKKDKYTIFILSDNKFNVRNFYENNLDYFQPYMRFHVRFRDFNREELKQIILVHLSESGYTIKDDAFEKLLDVIFLSKAYGNNINASAALAILQEIIVNQNTRTLETDNKVIDIEDIDKYVQDNDLAFIDASTGGQSDARKKLEELVGLEKIKDTIDDLIAYFHINRGKKLDFHMAFTGNPGTGKTEVARIVGRLMRQEGILPTSRFIEASRRDLVGQYIGQTAIITRDVIEKSIGGVLYIDEAYSLAYGGEKDFGKEAIAELIKAMEDRRGEFCVVLAGYTSEMKKLFDMNPGFKSRIKFDLEFQDYKDEELEQIARLFIERDNNEMSEENIKIFIKLISDQRRLPNFANARSVRSALSKIQIKQARRVQKEKLENLNSRELTLADIKAAFGEEEVNIVLELTNKKELEKPAPELFMKQYYDYPAVPFLENKDLVSECILALKKTGLTSGESTGFIISKEGYFLTCAHCVSGATKIEARRRIIHRNKQIDLYYEADVVSISEQDDVALCKIRNERNEEFDYLSLAGEHTEIVPLNKIYLLGYPFGVSRFDALSINEGKIASYQKGKDNEPDQINLDITAKGGNSGSPLIDEKTSRVIGILCGSSISNQGNIVEEINYCRPISYGWKLIEEGNKK